MKLLACIIATAGIAAAAPTVIGEPSADRWMYPSNATPGTRAQASTFSALPDSGGVEDRWGFFLVGFDTTAVVPAGLSPSAYRIRSVCLRATTGQDETFEYDPTYDSHRSYATPTTTTASCPATNPIPGRSTSTANRSTTPWTPATLGVSLPTRQKWKASSFTTAMRRCSRRRTATTSSPSTPTSA